MSSIIKIVKICEYCSNEFIAKTTTTKCCSDNCSKRFYKLKIKNDKIGKAELKTEIKRKLKAFITEEEIKVINVKREQDERKKKKDYNMNFYCFRKRI